MLPKEYASGSTCHRRFQEWMQLGIFYRPWTRLLKLHDNKKGITWNWQSLDSISIKSHLGTMRWHNSTDRGKLGTKRYFLTDKDGIPLSKMQTLCLDKAYHSNEIEQEIIKGGYNPHIRHRRERRK